MKSCGSGGGDFMRTTRPMHDGSMKAGGSRDGSFVQAYRGTDGAGVLRPMDHGSMKHEKDIGRFDRIGRE